jgi:hypothetical protein
LRKEFRIATHSKQHKKIATKIISCGEISITPEISVYREKKNK